VTISEEGIERRRRHDAVPTIFAWTNWEPPRRDRRPLNRLQIAKLERSSTETDRHVVDEQVVDEKEQDVIHVELEGQGEEQTVVESVIEWCREEVVDGRVEAAKDAIANANSLEELIAALREQYRLLVRMIA
jgi:hypothetical protein